MKFRFTRLGAIDEATIELAPLTVICGLNNTGKTYATYAIYALLATWRQLIDWEVNCGSIKQWPRRYFVFHDQGATPLTKRTTREAYNNTSPETALFISTHTGAKTYLRQLLDKPV